jgi:hypothetical protein
MLLQLVENVPEQKERVPRQQFLRQGEQCVSDRNDAGRHSAGHGEDEQQRRKDREKVVESQAAPLAKDRVVPTGPHGALGEFVE